MSRSLAVFLSQSRLGFAGRACGMATFFPCARRPRFSGKKEGDVSEVLEAGSTLYAVRRSPARPTAKISPARAPSQAQQDQEPEKPAPCTAGGGFKLSTQRYSLCHGSGHGKTSEV